MEPNPFRSSIHKILAQRLALVALVICIIFSAIAFVGEQTRLQSVITDLARIQVERFNQNVRSNFDAAPDIDGGALQAELDRFSDASGETEIADGHFVVARIYDQRGQQLASLSDPAYPKLGMVERALDAADLTPLLKDEFRVVTVRLGGAPFVGVALPMINSSDQVAGQLIGVFAVSNAAIARIRGDVFRTILYVIAIVLVTAAVVYPIIGGLIGRLTGLTANLLNANLETMQVLGSAIAKRDSDTDAHNYRVSVYSVAIAEVVGLSVPEIQSLIKGALLHDVGKLGIRDNVLLKPGKLDAEEFEVMKTHVDHGLDITARAKWLEDAMEVVGGHHEKFGGTGYPQGLSGKSIPITARIFAIADVFDALTSKRPYKEPIGFDKTLEILEEGRNSHFDPELLDVFRPLAKELYDEYGGRDGDKPRHKLEEITQRYFMADITALLS
jgi:HD-GYP domain-containing protein (c-di-GMP phosphodiesterase class II)